MICWKEKTILLGVTGGIAAYKAAQLCSDLVKTGAKVHVLMSANATQFVSPLTFETLTGNKAAVDTFDRNFQWNVAHVSLAKRADVCMVVPATANIIAKMAVGLADDMLSTTLLAAGCPKIVAPAMNTGMYENPVTMRNIQTLKELGIAVVEPETGRLACADTGKGKLAREEALFHALEVALTKEKDLTGCRILITAGPTCEALDPVRYLTNHSTGKMGYALAKAAQLRGARVTLVTGPTVLEPPMGVETVPIFSANQMFDAVTSRQTSQDIIIKAAAVADYRPASEAEDKIKKSEGEMELKLARNPDILAWLGEHKPAGQVLCGFSMETRDLIENSRQKLIRKHADMMVANNLKVQGAGFGVDTNVATILTKNRAEVLPQMEKSQLADVILDRALEFLKVKKK